MAYDFYEMLEMKVRAEVIRTAFKMAGLPEFMRDATQVFIDVDQRTRGTSVAILVPHLNVSMVRIIYTEDRHESNQDIVEHLVPDLLQTLQFWRDRPSEFFTGCLRDFEKTTIDRLNAEMEEKIRERQRQIASNPRTKRVLKLNEETQRNKT